MRSSSPLGAEFGAGIRAVRVSAAMRGFVVTPAILGLALREVLGVADAGGVAADELFSAHTAGSERGASGALPCGSARAFPRGSTMLGATTPRGIAS